MKERDYYSFRYNTEYTQNAFEPYHCFDGRLIAKKDSSGRIILVDTYWISSSNRTFTWKEAKTQGSLEFICNLNNVDDTHEGNLIYYSDRDIFDLSYQHGCYKKYAIRKGADRSKTKILSVLKNKITDAEWKIASSKREIETALKNIGEIKRDNLDIYI